jgi:hypothetical protein
MRTGGKRRRHRKCGIQSDVRFTLEYQAMKLKLKNFDYKRFLIQKGERVALGIAVGLMSIMILVSGLTTALGGHSASSNTREIKELADQAASKLKNSAPPANLGDLPGDIKEVQLAPIDPEWLECQNLYFDRSGDADRKWRRPKVLTPDEFKAEVVHGALLSHVLERGEDGKFMVGVLQATNNQPSEESKEKLREEFKSYRKWDKALSRLRLVGQRPGFPTGVGSPGAALGGPSGRGIAGAGLGGRGPGMMAGGMGQWGWGRRGREMSVKMVPEDELNHMGRMRLAEQIRPLRMVVVSGTFPYRQQVEEFRRALRFDSVDALLSDTRAIPEFMGIDVQRREVPPGGEPGDWEPLDVEASVRDIRMRAVGLEPENPGLLALGVIVRPNRLVMPRPRLVHHEPYAEPTLRSIYDTVATLESGPESALAPPPVAKSRFENLDPWSDSQPRGMGGGVAMAGGGFGRGSGEMGSAEEGGGPGGRGLGRGGLGGGLSIFSRRVSRRLERAGRKLEASGGIGGEGPSGGGFGGGGAGVGQMAGIGARAGGLPGGGFGGGAPGGTGAFGVSAPAGGGGLPGPRGMMAPSMGGQTRPGQTGARGPTARRFAPPDKCLLRFLDVTVQPGKTYEYRVKIKMVNPTYGKGELAVSKEAAADPVLVAQEWKQVTQRVGEDEAPLRVTVADELMYYAVDEKLDRRASPANSERAAVQIHRWLEDVRVNPSDKDSLVPVGEWSILEHLLVHRGEYIGRLEEVDVPVWRTTKNTWALAGHGDQPATRIDQLPPAKKKGVVVDFALDPVKQNASVLVDFEGGKETILSDRKPVADESPVEMLVLDASGKLIVHNSVADTQDPARLQRYTAWKGEVDSLKDQENGRRPGDDSLFQRGAPGRGGRRGGGA